MKGEEVSAVSLILMLIFAQSLCHPFVDNKDRFNERETILRLHSLVLKSKGQKKKTFELF
jgi:hypothetical protein